MVGLGEWLLKHYQKVLMVVLVLWGAHYAYTRPYSLGDPTTYVALIVGELLLVEVFHYRRVFFWVLMASFLWAGLTLPLKVFGAQPDGPSCCARQWWGWFCGSRRNASILAPCIWWHCLVLLRR